MLNFLEMLGLSQIEVDCRHWQLKLKTQRGYLAVKIVTRSQIRITKDQIKVKYFTFRGFCRGGGLPQFPTLNFIACLSKASSTAASSNSVMLQPWARACWGTMLCSDMPGIVLASRKKKVSPTRM